jgi:hypothetical protein
VKKYNIRRLRIECNSLGTLPLAMLQDVLPGVHVSGCTSSSNKHGRILQCATFSERLFLSDQSDPVYRKQVIEYDGGKEMKEVDGPDSLASCMMWMGLVKEK